MILQALTQYYKRLVDDPDCDIPSPGFESRELHFAVVLDIDGSVVSLQDLRNPDAGPRAGRRTLVPRGVKRSSGIKANLLWDTAPYALGIARPDPDKDPERLQARAVKQHAAFKARVEELAAEVEDDGVMAILAWMEQGDGARITSDPLWPDVEASGGNITFMMKGEGAFIMHHKPVRDAVAAANRGAGEQQVCSVTGRPDTPAVLHTAIKGVWGAQTSGANIVSFNLDSSESYGKKQGLNAPVGSYAEFAYTTALNRLLAKGSRQRVQVGDASAVFWSEQPTSLEQDMFWFLGGSREGEDQEQLAAIRDLLTAPKTGVLGDEKLVPFFLLGLAPNASRLSVRFWERGTVDEMRGRMAQHFRDIAIVRAPYDPEYLSLFRLLCAVALEGKVENAPPNIGGELMRAIFLGSPYPRTLLAAAVRRCKAEQNVTYARAALIKGVLVRDARVRKTETKEIHMALDTSNDNIGYVLGRLFAVLERIQEQAQPGLNRTIRDTYFSGGASSPRATFTRLQQLAIHHLAKIRNSGKRTVWLEKLMGDVMGLVSPDGIPATLSLENQGRFAIGYYHQRKDFFTKSETNENTEGEQA